MMGLKRLSFDSTSLPFGQYLELEAIGGPTYVTAQLLVQHAVLALATRVWTAPLDTFDLDLALQRWKQDFVTEALQSRPGAAEVIHGCGPDPNHAFIVASANLRYLLHAGQNAGVFHVAAVDDDSHGLVTDYASLFLLAGDYGLSMVCSLSVHEVQHMALLATLLAASGPVLHVYDGLHMGRETARVVDVLDLARLRQTLAKSRRMKVWHALTALNDELGTEYQPFEYHGGVSAPMILVVFGSVEVSAAIRLAEHSDQVGVINVRVYRPFFESDFLATVPATARKLLVLGQVGEGEVCSSLYRDVLAAVTLDSPRKIEVSEIRYPRDRVWSTAALSAELNVEFTETHPLEQYSLWHLDSDSCRDAGRTLAKAFATDSASNITTNSQYDNLHLGGVSQTSIRRSKRTVSVSGPVRDAHVVYVGDERLLSTYDIVGTLRQGGKLIIRMKGKIDPEQRLSPAVQQSLAHRRIQLYGLDPTALVMVNEEPQLEPLLVQIAFLRVARPMVEDIGIEKLALLNGSYDIFSKITRNLEKALYSFDISPSPGSSAAPGALFAPTSLGPFPDSEQPSTTAVTDWVDPSLGLVFKEAFETRTSLRPDVAGKTFTVRVRENRRLTPPSYERNIFHVEFALGDSGLQYEIGEALGIHAENESVQVLAFIEFYGLDANSVVQVPSREDDAMWECRTIYQALMQNIDLFGRPPKKFYEDLSHFADDSREATELRTLGSAEGSKEFARRAEVDTVTYADVLLQYTSARPSFDEIVRIVSPMKRREYSIASCQKVTPDSVALMIVVVGWVDSRGRHRFGQATRYLRDLQAGQPVTVSIKSSVMKLPPRSTQPLIMAGLGTGLAPFRAFVQHRAWEKAQGKAIGPVLLYMGSRHQREEYCYGEEWEAYQAAGVITLLGRAFSRDQPEKVYIQDRMRETLDDIVEAYLQREGAFYLCGPTWPVPDVTNVLQDAIAVDAAAQSRQVDPRAEIDRLKENSRYVLEVY